GAHAGRPALGHERRALHGGHALSQDQTRGSEPGWKSEGQTAAGWALRHHRRTLPEIEDPGPDRQPQPAWTGTAAERGDRRGSLAHEGPLSTGEQRHHISRTDVWRTGRGRAIGRQL